MSDIDISVPDEQHADQFNQAETGDTRWAGTRHWVRPRSRVFLVDPRRPGKAESKPAAPPPRTGARAVPLSGVQVDKHTTSRSPEKGREGRECERQCRTRRDTSHPKIMARTIDRCGPRVCVRAHALFLLTAAAVCSPHSPPHPARNGQHLDATKVGATTPKNGVKRTRRSHQASFVSPRPAKRESHPLMHPLLLLVPCIRCRQRQRDVNGGQRKRPCWHTQLLAHPGPRPLASAPQQ